LRGWDLLEGKKWLMGRSGEGFVVLWGEKRIWQKRRDFSKPRGEEI
jgi:hypothetical protein